MPLCTGSSHAETVKIGFVNIERIVREAPASILAGKKLESEFAARNKEIQQLAADLANKKSFLMDKGITLSDGQRRVKEKELYELDLLLQRRQREFQEDVQIRQTELTSSILAKANEAIKQVAEREKLDMVIQDAAWASPSIDITSPVLKTLANEN